jgi:zinc transport system ATP-binding protein
MSERADTAARPVIEIDRVSFSYNGEQVLRSVSLTVTAREFVWIVGPNGGGKTTLLKLLLGLLEPRTGSIRIFGRPVREVRTRLGYMPQRAHLDLRFPVRVLDVAMMGRLSPGMRPGAYSQADRDAALEALKSVGMDGLKERRLDELSGGQRQRLFIARALAAEPELLILDEPTASLDKQIEGELLTLLRALNQRLTIVMVSHDPTIVSEFVEKVVCVNRTLAVHPTGQLDHHLVQELYATPRRIVRHDLHEEGEL